jgi:GDP-L-fucose synthase
MNKNIKIYIAGHTGLVGSAIKRQLEKVGYKNLICKIHKKLDLTNQKKVEDFFQLNNQNGFLSLLHK